VKCHECRFGRWFGQDESGARLCSHSHSMVSVDYIVYASKRDRVRKLYGRRVRVIIPTKPIARVRVERRPYRQLELDTDVPPF